MGFYMFECEESSFAHDLKNHSVVSHRSMVLIVVSQFSAAPGASRPVVSVAAAAVIVFIIDF